MSSSKGEGPISNSELEALALLRASSPFDLTDWKVFTSLSVLIPNVLVMQLLCSGTEQHQRSFRPAAERTRYKASV